MLAGVLLTLADLAQQVQSEHSPKPPSTLLLHCMVALLKPKLLHMCLQVLQQLPPWAAGETE